MNESKVLPMCFGIFKHLRMAVNDFSNFKMPLVGQCFYQESNEACCNTAYTVKYTTDQARSLPEEIGLLKSFTEVKASIWQILLYK